MLFEDKLADILYTLESGKLLLAPIEFCWAVVYDPSQVAAYETIGSLSAHLHSPPFLLHDSIAMLKKSYPCLHPRVETLLLYHRRPLGVRPRDSTRLGDVAIKNFALCLTFDPFATHLVAMLGSPLACHYYAPYGQPAKSLQSIDSGITSAVGYTSKHKNDCDLKGIIPVVTSYDEEGLLQVD